MARLARRFVRRSAACKRSALHSKADTVPAPCSAGDKRCGFCRKGRPRAKQDDEGFSPHQLHDCWLLECLTSYESAITRAGLLPAPARCRLLSKTVLLSPAGRRRRRYRPNASEGAQRGLFWAFKRYLCSCARRPSLAPGCCAWRIPSRIDQTQPALASAPGAAAWVHEHETDAHAGADRQARGPACPRTARFESRDSNKSAPGQSLALCVDHTHSQARYVQRGAAPQEPRYSPTALDSQRRAGFSLAWFPRNDPQQPRRRSRRPPRPSGLRRVAAPRDLGADLEWRQPGCDRRPNQLGSGVLATRRTTSTH